VNSERPRISLIVAMSRNGVIGKDNRLPWHLPADLKRFKELTMGHTIVMGRKTWDSIKRLLPGRRSVIVSRDPSFEVAGAAVVDSLQQAIEAGRGDREIFVIGGEQIFRLALPHADRIYLTIVQAEFDGDTFMPPVDPAQWRRVSCESHAATESSPLAWRFEIHERIAAAGR
jgi:dihydrofolate reductase